MLLLAFDTATDVATSALVDDGRVLGERTSVPRTLLEDVDELLRNADASPADLDALVVGTGQEVYEHADRPRGRAGSRARAGAAGRRRLDPAGACECEGGRLPGRRRSPPRGLRVLGPRVLAPADHRAGAGNDGRRERGGPVSGDARGQGEFHVPPDDDEIHRPHACMPALAGEFLPAEEVAPLYVRSPDAKVRSPA